jgi:regulator of chromosome condensation
LNVFVFGEGSSGELGLGRIGPVIDVRRPRLNPNLLPEKAGVVQLAAGGMHVVALTHDNVLLTWGVNDQGALGRDTTYKDGDPVPHEPAKEAPADDESDDGPTVHDMNPLEAYPGAMSMENVPEGTIFTQVAAGDSSTLALTDKGHVYSCGTFRVSALLTSLVSDSNYIQQGNEGILGYNPNVKVQPTLTKLLNLKNIVKICCGDNHCLALDAKGNCFSWGSGQQNQLGRRVLERTRQQGLIPRDFGGLPKNKIAHVGAGAYHSFAVEKSGKVWAWGLNSYGNCGISTDAGDDEATIPVPTPVDTLKGKNVLNITGGSHHSLAVTADGEALVWGRLDGAQLGMDLSKLDEDDIIRDKGLVRILSTPKPIEGVGKAVLAAIGSDTSMVLNEAGKAFTWGFSANYQTGLGTDVDVPIARMIDNTAVREKVLVWGGLGGQFGIVASVASAAKN